MIVETKELATDDDAEVRENWTTLRDYQAELSTLLNLWAVYEEIDEHIPTFRSKLAKEDDEGAQNLILKMVAKTETGNQILAAISQIIVAKCGGELTSGIGPPTGAERQVSELVQRITGDSRPQTTRGG